MIKRLIFSILFVTLFLTGCSNNKVPKISTNVENSIKKVAKIYGEQNPQIIEIKTTQEEATQKTMYIVFLKGNFQYGTQKSQKLEFSIAEDGKKVWALTSDNWQEPEINMGN